MSLNIGYDAKRAYQNYTGLGNYSRDLLKNLFLNYPENNYLLYTPKSTRNPRLSFLSEFNNVTTKFPDSPVHKTFKGYWRSINLEKSLVKDKVDIFHGLSNEIPRRTSNFEHAETYLEGPGSQSCSSSILGSSTTPDGQSVCTCRCSRWLPKALTSRN